LVLHTLEELDDTAVRSIASGRAVLIYSGHYSTSQASIGCQRTSGEYCMNLIGHETLTLEALQGASALPSFSG
jgi:hypothetical protein